MPKITNLDLTEFLIECYESGRVVYWYGTYYNPCTTSLYNNKKAQFPAHYTSVRAAQYRKDIQENKICADCVGLVKGAVWSDCGARVPKYASNDCPDKSSDGLFSYCKSKGMQNGKISSIPEVPGLLLHKSGHVGVYIGNGYAIEAQGFDTDVRKTKVKGRGWTGWCKMPFIEYLAGAPTETVWALGDRVLAKGTKGDDVTELQEALVKLGFNLGKWGPKKNGVDGDFGPATMSAVMAFQTRVMLPADGVFNEETYVALKDALIHGLPVVVDEGAPEECGACEEPGDSNDDTGSNPDEDAPENAIRYVRATANVNVRNAPDTTGTILTTLKKGSKLPYTGTTQNGWHGVTYQGTAAWVSGKYSRLVEESKLIIDISQYNLVSDWDAVEDSVAFLWLRAGLRSKSATGPVVLDIRFQKYAAECVKRGMPFGVYFFGRAGTVARAKEESAAMAGWAKQYNPTVYAYDAEVSSQTHESIQAFVNDLAQRTGRPVGAYVAHHQYKVYRADKLALAYMWIPRYGTDDGTDQVEPDFPCDVHQFTSKGKVPGIEGNVDLNHLHGKTLAWFRGETQ